jgi:hypothetical protein
MLEVGDDTRSRFCVSLWPKRGSSVLAGDVLLLQSKTLIIVHLIIIVKN